MNDKKTIKDFYLLKKEQKKFAVLACYDYLTAQIAYQNGIDTLLVGDSANQHLLGHPNTLSAKMDFMVEITAAVRRAAPNAYIIADMPFLSYQCGTDKALKNAGRFIIESQADIVKIETSPSYLPVIKELTNAGIPVMAHIGIRPQTNIFAAQGKTVEQAIELISLAKNCTESGAEILLLEGVAAEVAKTIAQMVEIPVIGCGSGNGCDGNVLIAPDILGISGEKTPKFAKKFGNVAEEMSTAFTQYRHAVESGDFPDDQHSYHIKPDEIEQFENYLKEKNLIDPRTS